MSDHPTTPTTETPADRAIGKIRENFARLVTADQAELTGDHLTDPAPQLSDEAWSFLVEHGKVHTGGSFVRFDGDWGNWNWLWSEIWKRCQR